MAALASVTQPEGPPAMSKKPRHLFISRPTAVASALALLFPAQSLFAGEQVVSLDSVVITATRIEQSSFDVPVSIDVIDKERIRDGQYQVNASESLVRIPGIVAPNQSRFSSDQQISSRGFGARSSFGIRGVRIYADGIPLSMPDGQGQMGSFALSSAERMEVMRGPFSSLYGNSSGGVVQIITQEAPERDSITPSFYAGSFGTWRSGVQLGGRQEAVSYMLDASRFVTDGYRDHSAARRDQFNGKFTYRPDEDSRLNVVLNYVDQPYNQDPQGLNRKMMEANPKQAYSTAETYNTGGGKSQTHLGANFERRIDDRNTMTLVGYVGERDVLTRLGIKGDGDLSSGGVGNVSRSFAGTDARWTHRMPTATGDLTLTGGLNYEYMKDNRKGFVSNKGVPGALRRDEDNIVTNFDQYLQAEWKLGKDWIVSGGVRHSHVSFEANDRYIVPDKNPDDSGNVSYSNTSPVLGVLYHLTPAVNLYANLGKGFETPTFIELAYRPEGSGLNFGVLPSKSRNAEAGIKALIGEHSRLNLAVFDISTDKEIVTGINIDGRATYKNAGKTQRQGVEISLDSRLGENLNLYLAYAYLNATFQDAFISGTDKPVAAGNRIPGAPRQTAYGELAWRHPASGFSTAIEGRYSGKIYVDDTNSDAAESYAIANWRAGLEQRVGTWRIQEFVRVDNLFDKQYVGGVIVNDGNGRFFAPAPGRNFMAGISASIGF